MVIGVKRDISETGLLVLKTLAAVGVVVTVLALPGIAVAFAPFFSSPKERRSFNRTLNRMERRGFITLMGAGQSKTISITKKGKEFLNEQELWNTKLNRPKKWNREWHMVLFDFPKRFEKARRHFRLCISEWGFKQYQKSVFIFPYESEREIRELAEYLGVNKYIRYVRVKELDRSSEFSKTFKLK